MSIDSPYVQRTHPIDSILSAFRNAIESPGKTGAALTVEVYNAPYESASLIHLDSPGPAIDWVLLAADGDTIVVFDWSMGRPLEISWVGRDIARIRLAIGGNYHFSSIYVDAETRRVSPSIEDDFAFDAEAETVLTYDIDVLTLRELWTGRPLNSWAPADTEIRTLWERCDLKASLRDRTAVLRYDCGDGTVTRTISF